MLYRVAVDTMIACAVSSETLIPNDNVGNLFFKTPKHHSSANTCSYLGFKLNLSAFVKL